MSTSKIIFILAIIISMVFIAFKVVYPKPKEYPQCGNLDSDLYATEDTIPSEGRTLFKANCSACHYASSKRSTGPGLRDVLSRIPSREWAYAFVYDADSVIKSGDAYAVKIFMESNGSPHVKFRNRLSRKEIDLILDYCNRGPEEHKKVESLRVISCP